MKKYYGGTKVARGLYLNLSTFEFVPLDEGNYVLPNINQEYIKVPRWSPIFAGPLFGLVFIIFLPLAGIIGLISFLAYKAGFSSTNLGRKILNPILIGGRIGRHIP